MEVRGCGRCQVSVPGSVTGERGAVWPWPRGIWVRAGVGMGVGVQHGHQGAPMGGVGCVCAFRAKCV